MILGSLLAIARRRRPHPARISRKHSVAELPERVAADDAVDAVVVVAGEQERVLVVLDGGVGAAVDVEVFTQRAGCRERDLLSIGERPNQVIELDEKAITRLESLACGDIASRLRGADDPAVTTANR